MKKLREIVRFIGSLLVLVGIMVYLIAGYAAYQRSKAIRELPTVPGQVVEGFIYKRSGPLERAHVGSYGVRWMVRYRLEGAIDLSTTDLGYTSPSWRWMEYMKNTYTPSMTVKVYYSSQMFGRIVIVGDTFRQRQPVAFTLILLATGLVVLGFCLTLLANAGMKA